VSEDIPRDIKGVRRWLRDDEVRRGKRRPRTHREIEIWRAGLAERYPPRAEPESDDAYGRQDTKRLADDETPDEA
jgi:hypothetical protein